MRNLMKTPGRFPLLLVLDHKLISGSASRIASFPYCRAVDCADYCSEQRNKLLDTCNTLSDTPPRIAGSGEQNVDKCIEILTAAVAYDR